jgi:hypothetical protein
MAKAVIPLKNFYKRFGDKRGVTIRERIVELFLTGFEEAPKEEED